MIVWVDPLRPPPVPEARHVQDHDRCPTHVPIAARYAEQIRSAVQSGAAHASVRFLARTSAVRSIAAPPLRAWLYADGSALVVVRETVRVVDATEAVVAAGAGSRDLVRWLLRSPHKPLREAGLRLVATLDRT